MTELETVDIAGLRTSISDGNYELRRDIHAYMNYVQDYSVKRTYRENSLPKSDSLRLARLVSDPQAVDDIREFGGSDWIDYIDNLALKLGFVTYDTKGQYMGYTSSEPSYPDNYIKVNDDTYLQFLESSPDRQEQALLKVLIEDYAECRNEFFSQNILGLLDPFDRLGCGTGVIPTINFASIRKFMLDILALFQSGVWYSVGSLVQYLKHTSPYFLIPKDFNVKHKHDAKVRYSNFSERKEDDWTRIEIKVVDPDAFERVEGRYVERFLEGIPLVMGYVDTAYAEDYKPNIRPSLGHIRAFRVRDRLAKVMQNTVAAPRLWVQPNFEIYIESDIYPAQILSKLTPLTDVVKEDKVIILKLKKEKVAATASRDNGLDVVSLLRSFSDRDLPKNVLTELDAWNSHAEIFTLYEGYGLLEKTGELPEADKFTAERISPNISLVHSPDKLFGKLEDAGWVPLSTDHQNAALMQLPEGATTVFRRKTAAGVSQQKKKAVLKCKINIVHYFPTEELYEIFARKLLEAKCACELNKTGFAITVSARDSAFIKEIIKMLKKDYQIRIEDME